MQQKRSGDSFSLYRSLTYSVISALRKKGGREYKSMSDRDIIKLMTSYMDNGAGNAVNLVDFKIFATEQYWASTGKNAIFPESLDMINRLLLAKYDCSSGAVFNLPLSSFILAIPKNLSCDGVSIPSCLVTVGDLQLLYCDVINAFCDHINRPRPNIIQGGTSLDTPQISITYPDTDNKSISVQRWISKDQWAPMLNCKSSQEYHNHLITTKKYSEMDNTYHDSCVQYTLFKLIAGLGIYNSATNGDFLKPGLPGANLKFDNSVNERPENHFVIRESHGLIAANRAAPGQYVRGWFFRNLKDARYYKGEHENTAPGTRWVFVHDTIVNAEIDAHTATEIQ